MFQKKLAYISSCILLLLSVFILSKYFFYEDKREVVITIDDLPLIYSDSSTNDQLMGQIIYHLKQFKVPAVGFVIAQNVNPDTIQQLYDFQKNGYIVGNHTYSHPDLRHTEENKYIQDIALADQILLPFFPEQKLFRYPYMSMGAGKKRAVVQQYLSKNKYLYAPVTIDSKDFRFNAKFAMLGLDPKAAGFAVLKQQYLDYVEKKIIKRERQDKWLSFSYQSKKQTLLIHANALNSYALPDVLQLFKQRGYQFIAANNAGWESDIF